MSSFILLTLCCYLPNLESGFLVKKYKAFAIEFIVIDFFSFKTHLKSKTFLMHVSLNTEIQQ